MYNYFSHDSNARNSKKIIRLRQKHGAIGYAVYFMLLERLRDEEGFASDADYEMLSFDFRVEASIIKSVVEDFNLFHVDRETGRFCSVGLDQRMAKMEDTASVRSEAGKKGAESRWGKKPAQNGSEWQTDGKTMANAWQTDGKTMANAWQTDGNKIKLKETKEKDYSSSSPTPSSSLADASGPAYPPEEEQQQKLFFIALFFKKNFQAPEKEYQNLVNYNMVAERNWDRMSYKQRCAAAEMWQQKPVKPPRFPTIFLSAWLEVVKQMHRTSVPIDLQLDAMADRLDFQQTDRNVTLTCSRRLFDHLERSLENYEAQFRKFLINRKLLYKTYDT